MAKHDLPLATQDLPIDPIDPMIMRFVLGVIASGGTLAISGPSPTDRRGSPRYGASLESSSGAMHADAYGETLRAVLQELERQWRATGGGT